MKAPFITMIAASLSLLAGGAGDESRGRPGGLRNMVHETGSSSEEQRMAVCDGVPGHVCGAIGWSHWLTWLFFHYDAEDGLQPLTFIIHRWTPVQSVLLAMNLALVVLQITGGSLIVHTCSHIPGSDRALGYTYLVIGCVGFVWALGALMLLAQLRGKLDDGSVPPAPPSAPSSPRKNDGPATKSIMEPTNEVELHSMLARARASSLSSDSLDSLLPLGHRAPSSRSSRRRSRKGAPPPPPFPSDPPPSPSNLGGVGMAVPPFVPPLGKKAEQKADEEPNLVNQRAIQNDDTGKKREDGGGGYRDDDEEDANHPFEPVVCVLRTIPTGSAVDIGARQGVPSEEPEDDEAKQPQGDADAAAAVFGRGSMQITVMVLRTAKSWHFKCEPSDTIATVRREILAVLGLSSVSGSKLIYAGAGRELLGGRPLSFYGIRDGGAMQLELPQGAEQSITSTAGTKAGEAAGAAAQRSAAVDRQPPARQHKTAASGGGATSFFEAVNASRFVPFTDRRPQPDMVLIVDTGRRIHVWCGSEVPVAVQNSVAPRVKEYLRRYCRPLDLPISTISSKIGGKKARERERKVLLCIDRYKGRNGRLTLDSSRATSRRAETSSSALVLSDEIDCIRTIPTGSAVDIGARQGVPSEEPEDDEAKQPQGDADAAAAVFGRGSMQITVMVLRTAKSWHFKCEPSDTIATVRREILAVLGLSSVSGSKLIYAGAGRELLGGRPLSFYGIRDGGAMQLELPQGAEQSITSTAGTKAGAAAGAAAQRISSKISSSEPQQARLAVPTRT